MARRSAVAGMFYDGNPEGLTRSIEACFEGPLGPGRVPEPRADRLGNILGMVCPHAGYVYSGSAAAWAYYALALDGIPETAVILGPNHHGLGPVVSISAEDEWETPLGILRVDRRTARLILEHSVYASEDNAAHSREHSIEVQLPFLQYIAGDAVSIVPISISHLSEYDAMERASNLGQAIAKALDGRSAVIIASTDMTHYESRAEAQARDDAALREICLRDPRGLIMTVYEQGISMCGVIGTAVMLEACGRLGARTARRLAYYTSGDVTGDTSQVVGYAAAVVEK